MCRRTAFLLGFASPFTFHVFRDTRIVARITA
jgi:hypothetical protein